VRAAPEADLGSRERVSLALRLLLDSLLPARVYVDLSRAMDRAIPVAPAPAEVTERLGDTWRGATPRQFSARLLDVLDSMARRAPTVIALSATPRAGGVEILDAVEPLDLRGLFEQPRPVSWGETGKEPRLLVAAPAGPANLVIIVGGPLEDAARLGRPVDSSAAAVLVIDLSGEGHGLEIARAYDAVPSRVVAYWDPLAEGR
jgi:hypothetical protein